MPASETRMQTLLRRTKTVLSNKELQAALLLALAAMVPTVIEQASRYAKRKSTPTTDADVDVAKGADHSALRAQEQGWHAGDFEPDYDNDFGYTKDDRDNIGDNFEGNEYRG